MANAMRTAVKCFAFAEGTKNMDLGKKKCNK
jgi:hypothetical protein